MQADKAIEVTVTRIVVRPVNDRRPAGIVHNLAANLDPVADLNRTAWRERYVVDHLERTGRRLDVERFVRAPGARAEEESRRRSNRSMEVDERRRCAVIRCEQIHGAFQSRSRTPALGRLV